MQHSCILEQVLQLASLLNPEITQGQQSVSCCTSLFVLLTMLHVESQSGGRWLSQFVWLWLQGMRDCAQESLKQSNTNPQQLLNVMTEAGQQNEPRCLHDTLGQIIKLS